MGRIRVRFQDEAVELEIADERLVAAWDGPPALHPEALARQLAERLEHPVDFPALRQAVVPGDRVAIAIDARSAGVPGVVAACSDVLTEAGVVLAEITVVEAPGAAETPDVPLPDGVPRHRHDPAERTQLAYLAATADGRRIYLNRALTDADFVLPVGEIQFDPPSGIDGPWTVVFPGLSDEETIREIERSTGPGREAEEDGRIAPAVREAAEVCWLLGSQFQVGLVAGVEGIASVVAGLGEAVIRDGIAELRRLWEFRPESTAELVIAGVGAPGRPTTIEDVARGLSTAIRLVPRGGKVVILSRATGPVGPTISALRGLDSPREMLAAVTRQEDAPDHAAARRLAEALAWADVYLLSDLDRDLVEDLAIVPLDRPEEAGRLAGLCGSCLVLSQADRTRAAVREPHRP